VTLEKRPTCSSHNDQVRKRAFQRLGVLVYILDRRSDVSESKGVLLYRHLIHPMMDYACPVWRFAVRSHIRKLQLLQSKCLRTATAAPWYISNR
jgi:hypothetical protein